MKTFIHGSGEMLLLKYPYALRTRNVGQKIKFSAPFNTSMAKELFRCITLSLAACAVDRCSSIRSVCHPGFTKSLRFPKSMCNSNRQVTSPEARKLCSLHSYCCFATAVEHSCGLKIVCSPLQLHRFVSSVRALTSVWPHFWLYNSDLTILMQHVFTDLIRTCLASILESLKKIKDGPISKLIFKLLLLFFRDMTLCNCFLVSVCLHSEH